jgi:hypothetical protein
MDKQELQKSAEAKSDQIDADDMIGNITMDVTIEAVKRGTSEQPIQLVLKETEKFYRPNKTFRRALIGCFGDEPANWVGQRLRLARDPNVMWGGVKVGGVIVSHASIEAPMVFMLQAKRGKKSAVSIDVIPPIQKPVPMPAKVKEAAAVITKPARGTISGNALEGDLIGVGPDRPADEATKAKVIRAFAVIGYDQPMLEAEYGKPLAEWMESDVVEARELLKALTITAANAKAAADTDTGEV